MGIYGLLPLLRSITRKIHLEQLAGQAVAVDAYSWLHKGVYGSCAVDHFHGKTNDSFVEFCMSKVRLLLHFKVRPILVFDGAHLPMKRYQEQSRAKSRRENKVKAEQLLAQGNTAAAHAHIQKAVDVTPMMAAKLIAALRKAGVEYVVAPYEADAQMAYLDRTGAVAAVITEDSDLLLFGCKRVLFKLDRDAFVDEICTSRLTEFRHLCMLSGCDYLPSIHGMGLKTAYKYLCRYNDIGRVLQALRAEMPTKVPENYEADFAKAEMTFLHQRVYDLERKSLCFLNPIPMHHDGDDEGGEEAWDFLGPKLSESQARGVCEGFLCPNTLEPFTFFLGPSPSSIIMQPKEEFPKDLPLSEDDDLPLTPPSSLPFKIHLDKPRCLKFEELSSFSASPPSRNVTTTSGGRLLLKRPYTSQVDVNSCKENINIRPTSTTGRIFAFGETQDKIFKELSVYLPKPSTTINSGSGGSLTKKSNDSNQRSIREFFRQVPLNK